MHPPWAHLTTPPPSIEQIPQRALVIAPSTPLTHMAASTACTCTLGFHSAHATCTHCPLVALRNVPCLTGQSAQVTEREPPSRTRAPSSCAVCQRGMRICAAGTPAARCLSSYSLHGQQSQSPSGTRVTL